MKIGIMAARTQNAIEEIARKTGIDVATVKRYKNPQLTNLFRLEKLASELPERGTPGSYDVDIERILAAIKDTKGVGDALYKRIEDTLTG